MAGEPWEAHAEAYARLRQLCADEAAARRMSARPTGVLLTGLTGMGKTYVAQCLVQALNTGMEVAASPCSSLSSLSDASSLYSLPDVVPAVQHSARYTSALQLRNPQDIVSAFSGATVLVIDNVELLAPSSNTLAPPNRLWAVLAHRMETCRNTVVVGVTADDAGSMRALFGHEVSVSVSRASQREILLRQLFSNMSETAAFAALSPLGLAGTAQRTRGYSPADLAALVRMVVHDGRPVQDALAAVRPAVLRGLPMLAKDADAQGADSVGLVGLEAITERVKTAILDAVTVAMREEETLSGDDNSIATGSSQSIAGQRTLAPPVRGVLLHGPTGCGKTSAALAAVRATGLSAVVVQSASVRASIVGEAEKRLAALFARARAAAPCVLVLDDLDGMFVSRDRLSASGSSGGEGVDARLVACLLTELDGLCSRRAGDGVFVVATTRHIERIDAAVLRRGRVGLHIPVPPLDVAGLRALALRLAEGSVLDTDAVAVADAVVHAVGDSLPAAAELRQAFSEAALETLRADPEANCVPLASLLSVLRRYVKS